MEQNSTTGSRNIMPFKMAGSEKMRIDTLGNVGIGTSAPSYLLDVYGGSGRISTPSNDGTLYLGTSTVQYKNSTNTICLGAASINTAAATGTNNLAVGNACMGSVSSGSNNTACGNTALTGTTLGSNNTGVGFSAGSGITSGTGNVYVGAASAASSGGANNEIVIGAGAVGIGNNSVVLGNDNIATTSLNGNVGIKTKLPAAVLDVNGAAKIRGALDLSTQNITNANQISATTNLVLQPTTGNVGIGTSTPTTGYKLDVAGDIIKSSNYGGVVMYNSVQSYECSVVLHPMGAMTFKCSSSGVITSFANIDMLYDIMSPYITPANQFDMYRWVVNLTAGTYMFRMYYATSVDRGKPHLYVDNIFHIAFDAYTSTLGKAQTSFSVTINNTGTHKIELRIDDKNPSSSNYYFLFYCAGMLRTN